MTTNTSTSNSAANDPRYYEAQMPENSNTNNDATMEESSIQVSPPIRNTTHNANNNARLSGRKRPWDEIIKRKNSPEEAKRDRDKYDPIKKTKLSSNQ